MVTAWLQKYIQWATPLTVLLATGLALDERAVTSGDAMQSALDISAGWLGTPSRSILGSFLDATTTTSVHRSQVGQWVLARLTAGHEAGIDLRDWLNKGWALYSDIIGSQERKNYNTRPRDAREFCQRYGFTENSAWSEWVCARSQDEKATLKDLQERIKLTMSPDLMRSGYSEKTVKAAIKELTPRIEDLTQVNDEALVPIPAQRMVSAICMIIMTDHWSSYSYTRPGAGPPPKDPSAAVPSRMVMVSQIPGTGKSTCIIPGLISALFRLWPEHSAEQLDALRALNSKTPERTGVLLLVYPNRALRTAAVPIIKRMLSQATWQNTYCLTFW